MKKIICDSCGLEVFHYYDISIKYYQNLKLASLDGGLDNGGDKHVCSTCFVESDFLSDKEREKVNDAIERNRKESSPGPKAAANPSS